MSVDTLSRRALLEMKRDSGAFAPRIKAWPPKNYTAPTAEEFTALRTAARRRISRAVFTASWARIPDAEAIRHLQLLRIVPRTDGRDEHALYTYAHELRREANRRGLPAPQPLEVHRCESCSHGTERLFEATQKTHPGLSNRSDTPVESAWFCARCWSGWTLGDVWDGAADESETEDEG